MKRSIITLLTDFGTRDHYVASMKGVILGINPNVVLIDITHDVKPQDIEEGAFLLANACSYFPTGSIHLALVDPGVGSPRRPILLVTRNYFFLGPDNGLLALAAARDGVKEAREITRREFFLSPVSTTFHGRDIFAPAAAHLSLGAGPGSFGSRLNSWVDLDIGKAAVTGREMAGRVIHIDAFGNAVTNIDEAGLLEFIRGRSFMVKAGKRRITSLRRGYWEGKKGEAVALIGSGGTLEISIREGNAQKVLKIKKGDEIKVQVNLRSKA